VRWSPLSALPCRQRAGRLGKQAHADPFTTGGRTRRGPPDSTGHVVWAGYFGQQTRLDGSAVTLLNGCDGRRSLRAVCAEWERQQPVALHGKEPE